MIRFFSATFLWLVLVLSLSAPAVGKYASIVVDHHTGRVIHSVNADTRNYPASLTKIMTLFMTFEALRDGRLKPDQKLPVSYTAQNRSPSKLGLRKGQKIRVRDCVYALITKSANDAATVLAEAMGGTERKFARKMTRRARQLGMRNTTFRNASGLPNRGQLSTARDMSILARALLRSFPEEYRKFSRKHWKYKGRTYRNHNRLLASYGGADGIKTGYIRASGFNLVASAERKGRRIIVVVFGGKTSGSRDRIVTRLLNKGFATTSGQPANEKKTVQVAALRAKPDVNNSRKTDTRKPAQRRTSSAGGAGWAIQVGVYYQYADARRAVQRATRSVPGLRTAGHDIVTQKSKSRRHSNMYKARLRAATRASATSHCRALERRGINCMVLRTNPARETVRTTPRQAVASLKTAGPSAPARKTPRTTSSRARPAKAPAGRVKSWAIQVGVYYRYTEAERAVMRAARSVPALAGERYKIMTQKSKTRRYSKMYKARLLVASRTSARNYCRALERRRINCIVIKMG